MRKSKRILALSLAACIMTSGMTGCSSESASDDNQAVTLYSAESDIISDGSSEEATSEAMTEKETKKVKETTENQKETKEKETKEKETKDKGQKETTSKETNPEVKNEETTSVKEDKETTEETTLETTTEEETTTETEPETTEPSVVGLTAVAQVEKYVNVRTEPNTGAEIVGKIYNNCAATILNQVDGEDGEWYYMTSGNVTGYIKAEFFVVGDEAEALREVIGVTFARIVNDYTRVRTTPTLETMDNIVTMYRTGTEVAVVGIEGDFAKIETDAASTGYVHISCLEMWKEFQVAITLEEEAAKIAEQERKMEEYRQAVEEYERALAEQSLAASLAESSSIQESIDISLYESALQAMNEASIAASLAESASAQQAYDEYIAASIAQQQAIDASIAAEQAAATATQPTTEDVNSALRRAIVAYATQFVGCPYVHAGRSLTNGTDCSGFTSLVYAQFNVKLAWSPEEQCNQGVRISYTEALPGDLLFYSNSTSYLGHVAMYIGNGKIVHAANPQFGICIWDMMYREPLFAVRYVP